jgi:hypothetical protein
MASTPSILVEPSKPVSDQATAALEALPAPQTQQPEAQGRELPAKYKGKTAEELIDMLENAQTTIGRQSNEIGINRRLLDEIIEVKRAKDLGNPEPANATSKPAALTADQLLDNPHGAILGVMEAALEKSLKQISSRIDRTEQISEGDALSKDFPNYMATVGSPEFQAWVQRSQFRLRDAKAAYEKQDFSAARRLLEDWQEMQPATTPAKANTGETPAQSGVSAARGVSTESPGNGGASAPKKQYSQQELVNICLKDPGKWKSESFQKELKAAIREGRVDT